MKHTEQVHHAGIPLSIPSEHHLHPDLHGSRHSHCGPFHWRQRELRRPISCSADHRRESSWKQSLPFAEAGA
jgi:hypothetical protein